MKLLYIFQYCCFYGSFFLCLGSWSYKKRVLWKGVFISDNLLGSQKIAVLSYYFSK